MEEEINLHSYVDMLLPYGKWIVALAVALGVIAFIISSLIPPTFEASSVVIVMEPRYQIRFDPRFQTAQESEPASKAFQTLATSNDILQRVVDAYVPSAAAAIADWRPAALSGMVRVSQGQDPSLLVLTVRSRSAEDAAAIANAWADIVVVIGDSYYGESESDVAFFEEQVASAKKSLEAADAALIEYEAASQVNIVTAELQSANQALIDSLADQRMISYLNQDIQGLRDQLLQQPSDEPLAPGDALTALLLQIKAFNTQAVPPETPAGAPISLQVDGQLLSSKSPREQVMFLDDLKATLDAKSTQIDARVEELEPQILALQQVLQQATSGHDRLLRAQEVATETYLTLVRKLDEARIAAQEENRLFRVGSYAAVPEQPIGPRRLFNTLVAGVLGLVLGVLAAFAIEFWRQRPGQTQDSET